MKQFGTKTIFQSLLVGVLVFVLAMVADLLFFSKNLGSSIEYGLLFGIGFALLRVGVFYVANVENQKQQKTLDEAEKVSKEI